MAEDFVSELEAETESTQGAEGTKEAAPPAEKGEKGEALVEDEQAVARSDAKPEVKEPEKKEELVPLAAVRSEREKRQRLEREADELRERLRSVTEAKEHRPTKEELEVEYYKDPVGFHERMVAKRLAEDAEARYRRRLARSAQEMREEHADYDEVEAEFVSHARLNPELGQMVADSERPAEAAYRWMQRYRAKHAGETERLEKLQADLDEAKKQIALLSKQPPKSMPPSNAGARSASANKATAGSEDLLLQVFPD
jgi:hypothetical protein